MPKLTIGQEAELLKIALGVGRQNAQTIQTLSEKTGISHRRIHTVVNYMTRVLGETIGSSKSAPAGLWIADSYGEYKATIIAHKTEANTMIRDTEIMERNARDKWGDYTVDDAWSDMEEIN